MQIESQFQVAASPERVYSFLLDVNRVVTCMPGAELSEVVDPTTFKGKVKIKVGPITVSYNGTARIADRDDENRVATLEARGRETTGSGSANATARMTVAAGENGTSTVTLATDFTVAGRIANFGRGVMEDVSKRLVSQMADCIKANLETETPAETPASTGAPAPEGPGAAPAGTRSETAPGADAPVASSPPASPTVAPARPVNALSLFFAVMWDRIRRLFRQR
jgi:carbon monoxide dehydrogenase subunit G